jgi:UDP-glucose 4-epimerase
VILVTGGAGFIGSHLVDALVARGDRVRVLDDLSSGHEENLAAVRSKVDFVRGSVVDPATVARALAGVSKVFHLAACPSVPKSYAEPEFCHAVNATGTLQVVVAAARAKCARLVFASSCSVYGDAGDTPANEDRPLAPKSPYAAQKLLGEHYLAHYGEAQRLATTSLRFFNVYGPRQDPSSPYSGVISIFCERLLRGAAPTLFGDGRQTRDFVFVGDVVDALLRASDSDAAAGAVVNVATGTSRTLLDLYRGLAKELGVTAPPRHGPARVGDIRHSAADVTRMRALLGAPRVEFADGLARTLSWLRSQDATRPGVAR